MNVLDIKSQDNHHAGYVELLWVKRWTFLLLPSFLLVNARVQTNYMVE